jgi:hypothetical protein
MSHFFWLSTLIPGLAVLQLLFPRDTHRGLLPALAWSFVLTVAIATPFVVVAFLFQLSASVVAAFYAGLVAVGLVVIARAARWRDLGRELRSTCWLEIGILLCVVAVTIPLGGAVTDDSFVHAAKIRYMRDVGFSLQDPYSPTSVIETRYHVSVHHSLYAIAARLTGEEPLELWFRSAWFFRLIGLGGIGFLAASIFRSRWVGAVAMLAAVGIVASLPQITYPFAMTPYVAFPVLLAHVLDLVERPAGRRALRVLLASLGVAVLHIGFWLIVMMCLVPVLFIWAAWGWPGWRPAGARARAVILPAVLPGLPFLLVTALQPNYVDAQQGLEHVWMLRTVNAGGWTITILDPTHYLWMLPTAAATVLLFAIRRQARARQLIVAAVFAASMVYMFTPGLFDLQTRFIPYWLIRRARFVGEVIAYANVAGGLAWLSRRALRTRASRMAFAVTVFCAGLVVFRVSINDYILDRQDQREWLARSRELQEVVRIVPDRSLIAADTEWSLVLPSVHLASVMAPKLFNANPADGGVLQRHKDAEELLDDETSASRRREIIARNGVDFILIANEHSAGVADIGELVASKHGFQLFKVRP